MMPVFTPNLIWDCLIVQPCDVLEIPKPEQSVILGVLSNSTEKYNFAKLLSVQLQSLSTKPICGRVGHPEMLQTQ